MRYVLMLSLAALFLAACGETDNPVVPTAPAGKVAVDLSEEECAATDSLPAGFLELALQANPNLDKETLLSTWKSHGCKDWVLWGLSWVASLDADVTFEVKSFKQSKSVEADHEKPGDDPIHTQSEIDRYHGRQTRWTSSGSNQVNLLNVSTRNEQRFQNLQEAGVLPTVSVSGCGKDIPDPQDGSFDGTFDVAVFTFTRNGPTDENLSFSFYVYVGTGTNNYNKIITGFGAGNSTFQWEKALGSDPVRVEMIEGWHNDMTDDFQLGTSSASVSMSTGACP